MPSCSGWHNEHVPSATAAERGGDWTRDEVEATVADYFAMLDLELQAEAYSKAAHNRLQQRPPQQGFHRVQAPEHQRRPCQLPPAVHSRLPAAAELPGALEQAVLEWLAAPAVLCQRRRRAGAGGGAAGPPTIVVRRT